VEKVANVEKQYFDELRPSQDGRHLEVVDLQSNRFTSLRAEHLVLSTNSSSSGEFEVSVSSDGAPFHSRRKFTDKATFDAYAESLARIVTSVR
jgi:hypothetical protein